MSYSAIELYYIDGISRENTPYFASVAAQASYFASMKFATIDNSYYVPHYQDKIKVDTDDVSIFNKVNYLSITYGSKKFYYFIDSVEYISEDVIELSITLDSIQTFMFNIIYHDGIVERQHIDRWILDHGIYYFNRDYIRENISNGIWNEPVYNYINLDDYGYFIGQSKNFVNGSGGTNLFDNILVLNYNSDYLYDSSIKYFAPFFRGDGDGHNVQALHTDIPNTTASAIYNQYVALAGLIGDEDIEQIMYIPFNPFLYNEFGTDTGYTPSRRYMKMKGCKLKVFNGAATYFQIQAGEANSTSATSNPQTYIEFKLYDSVTLAELNTHKAVPFKSSYQTCMVDENYMTINFGERSYCAAFPLYYTNYNLLYLKYCADISSGSRLYGISDDKDDVTFSKGGIVTAPPIYFTKINEVWKNWQAQNRATIPMAMLNVGVEAMKSILTYGAGEITSRAQNDIAQRRPLFPDTKGRIDQRSKAEAAFSRYSSGIMRGANADANAIELGRGLIGSGQSLLSTVTSAVNAYYTPDSIKQTSMQLLDYLSGSLRNVYYELKVNDFDQCAYFYHKYGNRVDKPFSLHSQASTIFSEMKTRYRFNYFKFQCIDIDIDMLCSENMIDDLRNRLLTGVRQWYLDHGTMCDYQFDNVEESLRTD